MERLEQIKKAVEDAKMDSLLFGQLLSDIEWLIEKAEKVERLEKDVDFWKDLAESCECNN